MLADNVAVVTGGARGIGRGIVEALSARGATVVINYSRSNKEADDLCEQIISKGGQAASVQFDVGDALQVERGFSEILTKFGRLDLLVNNAGIASDALLVRTKNEDWQRTIDINLSGAFFCSRAAAKQMMKQRHGSIINISSVIGEMGNAGQAAYSASKAGLLGLTKSLARELASRNVTVNAITPGFIQTDMTAELSSEQQQGILNQIPLARLGDVGDVAELVVFLASPAANYITGQVIGVNGGMYM